MTAMVKEITPVSSLLLRVKFGSQIKGKPAFLDPDNYSFTEGLEAVGVVLLDETTVELMTTPQEIDRKYQLSVSINV